MVYDENLYLMLTDVEYYVVNIVHVPVHHRSPSGLITKFSKFTVKVNDFVFLIK